MLKREDRVRHAAEPLVAQLELGDGERLVGDIGLIAMKAVLENGVGYVVTGWTEASNPIDAAISSCQRSVFSRRGILLRRLRSSSVVADLVQSPGDSALGSGIPMRGLVVWNGRSGVRPAIERVMQVSVPGPVVVLCMDPEVVRIPNAPVIDPAPSPRGLMEAIDTAFALSKLIGRPACVVLRSNTLDMRGTLVCRDNVSVADAAVLDADPAESESLIAACSRLGVDAVVRGGDESSDGMIVAPEPCAGAVAAAIRQLVSALVDQGLNAAAARVSDITVVSRLVPSVATERTVERIRCHRHVLVLEAGATGDTNRVEVVDGVAVTRARIAVDYGDVQVCARIVARWLLESGMLDDVPDVRDLLAAVVARTVPESALRVTERIPRRGVGMSSPVPDHVMAALEIVQADIGVPARISDQYASFLTGGGGALTVVHSLLLEERGALCAAPVAQRGTFVVFGPLSTAVHAACSAMGATMEVVDGSHPRRVAMAIARSVAEPDIQPRVILVAEGVPAPIDPRSVVGVDRELIRAERISSAVMPPHAIAIGEDRDDPLSPGASIQLVDACAVQAGISAARELSPGWYSVRVDNRTSMTWWNRMRWAVRRRVIRSVGGLEA